MESLHLSFQRVVDAGLFKGIKLNSSTTISHMFYTDDVVFVGQWCEGNITTLTHVLECFYRSSGLRINMAKSKIMGTLVAKDTVNNAAVKLGCLILNTPFTYLGTKVGGRLTLIKSVLTAIPIFHLSIYKAPLAVLRKLESIRCHFFHGHVHNSTQACWIKWSKILALKDKGGLGAIHGVDGQIGKHITVCNNSSWLHIVKEMGVLNHLGDDSLKNLYPRVYALENSEDVTVRSKLTDLRLEHSFRRDPRGGIEQAQFSSLEIDNIRLAVVSSKTQWIKSVPIKVNIIAWKVKLDALPTRLNISRRGIAINSILCPICDSGVESSNHLFFMCNLALQLSRKISHWWDIPPFEGGVAIAFDDDDGTEI
ncbi:RNA-directed DNA polymerase, eukaryota, reverse transcriptase zinc-binding domain protein [Tanacetum coccineum]